MPLPTSRPGPTRARLALPLVAALVAVLLPGHAASADAPGWRLVLSDDFSGNELDSSQWGVYGGPGRTRAQENTFVHDGVLTLRTTQVAGNWKAAGVSNARGLSQTYGKYEVRARFDAGHGVRACGLLWPAWGGWPPEVDFLEIAANDPQRTENDVTNHYGATNRMEHGSYEADFTTWHTVGLEWTPDALVYTLDGEEKVRMTENVPDRPMWLALQSGITGLSARPSSLTPDVVDFDIDWVRVYERA